MASNRLPPLSRGPSPPEGPGSFEGDASPEEVVVAYHERTKHHFYRFAASLGYMDWATQPDPFRRYAGADLRTSPAAQAGRPLPYWQLYTIGTVPPEPLSPGVGLPLLPVRTVSDGVEAIPGDDVVLAREPFERESSSDRGLCRSTRDRAARRHARRVPLRSEGRTLSSGERFSTRSSGPSSSRPSLKRSFLVGLSSVHWREAWKYGERAFRYCQHDVGHALATMRIAAAALGWRLVLLDGVSDGTVSSLLGLGRDEDFGEAEREEPELLALIAPELSSTVPRCLNEMTADGVVCSGRAGPTR